ncbi:hypothetical protein [Halovenus sp. HT40]|uniref:hypothetical protein n=1 Tax=Halovenus sp. HT40 TaxID=3126691 RepID=UPI00300EABB9
MPQKQLNRRHVLAGVATAVTTTVAGCSITFEDGEQSSEDNSSGENGNTNTGTQPGQPAYQSQSINVGVVLPGCVAGDSLSPDVVPTAALQDAITSGLSGHVTAPVNVVVEKSQTGTTSNATIRNTQSGVRDETPQSTVTVELTVIPVSPPTNLASDSAAVGMQTQSAMLTAVAENNFDVAVVVTRPGTFRHDITASGEFGAATTQVTIPHSTVTDQHPIGVPASWFKGGDLVSDTYQAIPIAYDAFVIASHKDIVARAGELPGTIPELNRWVSEGRSTVSAEAPSKSGVVVPLTSKGEKSRALLALFRAAGVHSSYPHTVGVPEDTAEGEVFAGGDDGIKSVYDVVTEFKRSIDPRSRNSTEGDAADMIASKTAPIAVGRLSRFLQHPDSKSFVFGHFPVGGAAGSRSGKFREATIVEGVCVGGIIPAEPGVVKPSETPFKQAFNQYAAPEIVRSVSAHVSPEIPKINRVYAPGVEKDAVGNRASGGNILQKLATTGMPWPLAGSVTAAETLAPIAMQYLAEEIPRSRLAVITEGAETELQGLY